MKSLLSLMLSAGLGLWLATLFVAGVSVQVYPNSNFFGAPIAASWELFILFGIILGLLNFFVKPILNIITLPLRIITLGLFGFVISIGMIWILDHIFREFSIPLLYPILATSFIIWAIHLLLSKTVLKSDQ